MLFETDHLSWTWRFCLCGFFVTLFNFFINFRARIVKICGNLWFFVITEIMKKTAIWLKMLAKCNVFFGFCLLSNMLPVNSNNNKALTLKYFAQLFGSKSLKLKLSENWLVTTFVWNENTKQDRYRNRILHQTIRMD